MSVGEIALCFFFGKFLSFMWILINALQLVVLLGIWQILYPYFLKVVFNELKRVSWAEYLDDLEIGRRMNELLFGTDDLQDVKLTSDKLGEERLGSSNMFESLGVSVLILSLLFFLALIVIAVIIVCCKKKEWSEKNQERIENLKRKIKYNPVIRYFLLNSIKFNYSALCVLKQSNAGVWSQVTAVLMLGFINLCPLVLSAILYKRNDELQDKERISMMGTLYEGKNVESQRKHRVWSYPLVFFYRRLIFAVCTVTLFDYPSIQMMMH